MEDVNTESQKGQHQSNHLMFFVNTCSIFIYVYISFVQTFCSNVSLYNNEICPLFTDLNLYSTENAQKLQCFNNEQKTIVEMNAFQLLKKLSFNNKLLNNYFE